MYVVYVRLLVLESQSQWQIGPQDKQRYKVFGFFKWFWNWIQFWSIASEPSSSSFVSGLVLCLRFESRLPETKRKQIIISLSLTPVNSDSWWVFVCRSHASVLPPDCSVRRSMGFTQQSFGLHDFCSCHLNLCLIALTVFLKNSL